MKNNPLPRLDCNSDVAQSLLPYCRLSPGDIWEDPEGLHRVGCLDAANEDHVNKLHDGESVQLAIHDPPYNLVAFEERQLRQFIGWCERWVRHSVSHLANDSSLYIWLGADQKNGFQPLPDFMIMMRGIEQLKPRSFITMRNQRGYGTQKNWMAVRQELLYYVKGNPQFEVQYTDIPKILRGYYKEVRGQVTENFERGRSENIRAGNVWVDIQQTFYRMQENVSGCYAQKPLKCIDRIVQANSRKGDLVVDYFSHSGTTLVSSERLGRRCLTMDIDPLFCELTIRRLEHYRHCGELGWQNSHPFLEIMHPEDDEKQEKEGHTSAPSAQRTLF